VIRRLSINGAAGTFLFVLGTVIILAGLFKPLSFGLKRTVTANSTDSGGTRMDSGVATMDSGSVKMGIPPDRDSLRDADTMSK
jgi:hypothetical protein